MNILYVKDSLLRNEILTAPINVTNIIYLICVQENITKNMALTVTTKIVMKIMNSGRLHMARKEVLYLKLISRFFLTLSVKEFDTADDYEDEETEIEAGDKPIDPNFKPIPYYSLVSS